MSSELASASADIGGQNEGHEPSTATAAGPEASEAGAVAPERLPASVWDDGPAKPNQPEREPSREAETKPFGASKDDAVAPPPVTTPSAADNALAGALAALDRRDYGTARRLFEALARDDAVAAIDNALEALDRKDYPAAQALFEALALKPRSSSGGTASPAAPAEPDPKPVAPPQVVPVVTPVERPSVLQRTKRRGARRLAYAASLAVLALLIADSIYGWRLNLAFLRGKAPATLASVVPAAEAPKAAAEAERNDQRAEIDDLKAALSQTMTRLDHVEQDLRTRLDKVGQGAGANGPAVSADVAARLDALEKGAAAPAPPAALGDVEARLGRLEKSAAEAPQASTLADVSARLDRLEKRASQAASAASSTPAPTPPKRPPTIARAQPDGDPAGPTASRRVLQDYAVEDVEDGVAVVTTRYGTQQVAPGDYLPGAGRVLRIERRGGGWHVLTSNGVIAGAPQPY